MRIMTKGQERLLQDLLKRAEGDSLLVERTLREMATKENPSLQDVITFIEQENNRKKHPAAA